MNRTNMNQKSVQVMPKTFILIDSDQDPEEAKRKWLEKFNKRKGYKPLDKNQVRRERETIRSGKVMQRTKYKK